MTDELKPTRQPSLTALALADAARLGMTEECAEVETSTILPRHREAAADLSLTRRHKEITLAGGYDDTRLVQSFASFEARHRIAATDTQVSKLVSAGKQALDWLEQDDNAYGPTESGLLEHIINNLSAALDGMGEKA